MSSAAGAVAAASQRGADLRYDLEISFDEAAKGTETSIQIPRQETCETCAGTGAAAGSKPTTCPQCHGRGQLRYQQGFFTVARTCGQCRGTGSVIAKPCPTCRGAGRVQKERKLTVRVPAGIATGQRLRLTGEGEGGGPGGPPGDLYVVIHVQDHPFFHRDGNDLYCEVPLNFSTVALGGEITDSDARGRRAVQGARGHRKRPVVPAAWARHAGRDRPRARRSVRDVKVITPKKLTREQKKLLEQLAASLPKEQFEPTPVNHEDKGLFDRVKDIFG